MALEVMTPYHPRWGEFFKRLDRALLTLEDPNTGESDWMCPGDPDLPLATAILELMAGVDVAESLTYFAAHDGGCDCEILLNVEADVQARKAE